MFAVGVFTKSSWLEEWLSLLRIATLIESIEVTAIFIWGIVISLSRIKPRH